jgi:hypothetical protein
LQDTVTKRFFVVFSHHPITVTAIPFAKLHALIPCSNNNFGRFIGADKVGAQRCLRKNPAGS